MVMFYAYILHEVYRWRRALTVCNEIRLPEAGLRARYTINELWTMNIIL